MIQPNDFEAALDAQEANDAEHIRKVCATNGLKITVGEARAAWLKHSDDWCAGWLALPDDAAVWVHIQRWHKRDHIHGSR